MTSTGWTKRLETARVLFSNWVSSAGSAKSIRALRTGISRLSIVHNHLLISAKLLKVICPSEFIDSKDVKKITELTI